MATLKTGLNERYSIQPESLGGPGPIAFNPAALDAVNDRKRDIIDYVRLRLADGIVDVELDEQHYNLAIKQALVKYRQRASNSVEESYAFLELLPETQEYILPAEIKQVRQVFRRGIGSVTGTTASQFEPFASGYLNTYMLVAGRVGGLTNYELYTHYQEQAMKMFGGYMNFTWNPTTRKLTLVRKVPDGGRNYVRVNAVTSTGTAIGSTITLTLAQTMALSVNDTLVIHNSDVSGYNGSYTILTYNVTTLQVTMAATNILGATTITGFSLSKLQVSSPRTDTAAEIILLHIYNVKPDQMLLNDTYAFPWLQDYAYSFAKFILGEARSKFGTIAGPQGGTTLNGTALLAEAKEEMTKLEEDLKTYVDGGTPLTFVIG